MNSRFTLAIVLLLSSAPYAATFANDRECRSDLAQMMCDCREANSKLVVNSDDAAVFLGALVSERILQEYPTCDFRPDARLRKFLKKYLLNRFIVKDAVKLTIDLPSMGRVTVLNTDQFLEVALVVLHDLIAHRSLHHTAVDGLVTLTREEIVAVLVWVLGETNVESILPSDLENTRAYQEIRNEVARYYVDQAIARVR